MNLVEASPQYTSSKSRFKMLDISSPTASHIKPSIKEPPSLELKPLPSHLRYAFLCESCTLLVIISFSLNDEQENKLLKVLREYKMALGWSIADIKGFSPSICMHNILFEDDYQPTIEHQCA